MFTTACSRGASWRRVLRSVVVAGGVGLSAMPMVGQAQVDPFIGEVMCGGWNFCPVGWAECNGQQMSIADNTALFSLLGTTYGGDGQTSFALPNIQSRTVIGMGAGPGLSNRLLGEAAGSETVTLWQGELPNHSHSLQAHSGPEQAATPRDRIPGTAPASAPVYGATVNNMLTPAAVSVVGGSQPHNNLQPYLTVKCCIALQGAYPSPS